MSSVEGEVDAQIKKDIRDVLDGVVQEVAERHETHSAIESLLHDMTGKVDEDFKAETAIARNVQTLLHRLSHSEEQAPAGALPPAQATDISSSDETPDKDLQGILDAYKELQRLRRSIEEIVENIVNNPTLLHKLAMAYGKLNNVEKVAGSTVIAGVAVCGASLMSAAAIIALCGGSNFVFDEYSQHIKSVEKKAEGVASLSAGLITQVMESISALYVKMNEGFKRFQEKEQKFQFQVFEQGREIDRLMSTIEKLSDESTQLKSAVIAHQKIVDDMQSRLGTQSEELAQRQRELDAVLSRFERTQQSLESRNLELTALNCQLAEQTERSQKSVKSLTEIVTIMAQRQEADKKEKEAYKAQLQGALASVQSTFDAVASKVSATEHAFTGIQRTLDANMRLHTELQRAEAERAERYHAVMDKGKLGEPVQTKVGSGLPGLSMWAKAGDRTGAAASTSHLGVHL